MDVLDNIYRRDLVDLYPNLALAMRLILTLPVTVATGERSFSSLKLIKTFLRTTMAQERLSSLSLIAIERDICKGLSYDKLVSQFFAMKKRRLWSVMCDLTI